MTSLKMKKAVDLGSSDEDSDASQEDSMASDSEDEEEEYPPTPPAYCYPDDGECRPPFVLVDQQAYLADRHSNATTATATALKGSKLRGSIKVTFCPVAPPLVSYLCFHAPDMDHTEFPLQPTIITTETNGPLLLLRVVVGDDPFDSVSVSNREYLVYNASTAKLDHLPHPRRQHEFDEDTLAILRKCNQHCQRTTTTTTSSLRHCHLAPHGHGQGAACQEHHHDCTYILAAQPPSFGGAQTSHLCMYHSDTQTWSKKPVVVANSYPPHHITSKTLNIGGGKGTVAWVDLWHTIIFCDVLDKQPKLRCLNLPNAIMPQKAVRRGDPRSVRDIAVVGNFIKFVDMHRHFHGSSRTSKRWKAATWSIRTGSFSAKDWTMEHNINSTQIHPQSSLLHKLKADAGIKAADLTLSTLHVGLPKLSLQDDDIVYFLAKIDYRDSSHTAWVLALDMRNVTVKEVVALSAKRTLGLARGYNASRISAYLKLDPNRTPKRPGMPLLKSPSKKHTGDDALVKYLAKNLA